jgi:DNA-binding protein H-NS
MRDTKISVDDSFAASARVVRFTRTNLGGTIMDRKALESMSSDKLWTLYEQLSSILADRIAVDKAKLEERLRKLETAGNTISLDRVRRPYPKVLPKYQNPKNCSETWAGRGKQPRWLVAQLQSGKKLEDFQITRA